MIYLKDGNTPLNEACADEIYQEGNSTYQLTFKYPLSSDKWKLLKEETEIIADDLHGEQEFTIFEVVKEQGYITVYANQIATLLKYHSISSINVDRAAGNVVMTALAGAILRDCPFSFYSDITEKHTFNAANISVMDALIKEKHSIVGQWGGDLVRDKYQVSLLKNGGSETEALFMYKKNMRSPQQTTSTKELRTRIHFRKKIEVGEGDNRKEQWLRVTVDSPLISKYKHIYEDDMEVTDEDVKDLASLTKYGEQYYRTTLCDMIEDSLELDVAGIGDVAVKIFDIASVYHEQFEIDVRKKITKYRYSPMGKRLKSVGFGTIQQTLGGALHAMVSDSVKAETATIEQDFEIKLEKELKNADKVFDQKMNQMEQSLSDEIEQARAKAEEVKAAMTEQLNLKINQSKSEVTEHLKSDFDRKLATAQNDLAGVRTNLTQAQSQLSGSISQIKADIGAIRTKQSQAETEISKQVSALNQTKVELAGVKTNLTQAQNQLSDNISQIQSDIAAIRGKQSQADNELVKQVQSINQAKSDLTGVKTDLTQAQSQLNSNISQIRSDVGSIRTKQGQHETEIAKQVQALNATKTELAGVKYAQATFEQTTTRRLAELTNLADGKASKSELTQTAQELSSRIASVEVGGVNLLKGTKDFSGSWVNVHQWTRETEKYKGLTVMSRAGSWLGLSQPFEAKKGETYTFSFYCKSNTENDRANVYFVHNSTSPQAIASPTVSSMVISNEWQRFSVTFKITESGFILPRIERFNTDNRVYVAGLKLEHGTIATDYSENPEDVDGRVSTVESSFKQRADLLEAGVARLTEGLKTKADSSALTVLSDSIKQSVKSLETDTDNKLAQKLSTAEFEVRASGIRQEIVNATKDKADKTLVMAEAGRLREELANLSVGENLFINSEFKNLRDSGQRYAANGKTYQNMIAPYWYNPYNAGLPNAQNIQHGYFDTSMSSDTVFAFDESDGSRHWKALSTDFKIGVITAGEYYFSADLYAAGLGTYIVVGFYYHDASGRMNFYSGRKRIDVNEKGRWTRLGIDLNVNSDIDLTKKVQFYIYGYNFASNSILYLKKPKVSKGRLKSDWSPALEDTESLITEAKAVFERTAQGLRTDLAAVQAYVSADSTRAEALRTYSREETARQLTAERKLIESGYVAKAQHTEDVRGLTRRFEELNSGGPNLVSNGATELGLKDWSANGKLTANRKHPFLKNGTATMFVLDTTESTIAFMQQNQYNALKRNTDYTLSFTAFASSNVSGFRALVGLLSNTDHAWKKTLHTYTKSLSSTQAERITVQFNSGDYDGFALRFDNMGSSNGRSATVWISEIDVYEGAMKRPYQPSPVNGQSYADTKLAEYKQGIDGQLANVQSTLNTANSSLTSFNTWKQSAQETLNKVGRVETGLNETKTSLAEFKRTAEGQLTTIAQQVAGKASQTEFKQKADSLEAGVNRLTEGLKTKADSSALNLLSDRILASVKSLETGMDNKLDSKLSTAEFEVRASGIRQEILNATKDKADKTLVTAEAGKLREELASLAVGGRNLALGTSKEWSTPFTNFSGNPNICPQLYKVLTDGLQVGDTLRSKIILKYTDVRPATGKTATVWLQGNGNVTGWTAGAYNGSPAKTLSGSGEITFEHSFKITENHLKNAHWNWMFRTDFIASGSLQWKLAKVESGSVFTNWSPAPEDTEGLITEAKATFERTAQGLRTDLSAVQAYVNADGTRSEALRTYSREETARQLTAERKLIESGYVGKAQHTEDVRSISRRFEELKTSSETKLAEYRQTIEGQFATMSSKIGESLKKTDISITPGQIILGTGKVVNGQTLASLFVQNPESMQAITKLMRITGDLIVDGSITGHDLAAGAITTPHLAAGAVTAEVLGANAVTADKVKADDALLEKLTAGEALLRKLMAKDAFINRLQSIDFTAEQVKGGMIKALNGALKIDLNNGQYNVMTDQAAIRRVLNGYPNQFLKFTSETEGGAPASVTVLGANRDGTENSKNDSFAGIRLFSGNKVERTEIISDVVRFATGAVNYRGWEMRTLYGNDNRQVILQPFGNVTRSNIVANYFNGIDLVNVLETLNQMMANLGNHTGRHDIFGPIRGLGARKYVR